MKILIILHYGWEFGGGETSTLNQKRGLERRGHIVKILSSNNNPEKRHFSDYEFKEFNSGILKYIPQIFNLRSYFKLKQVLKEFKPDIVHIRAIDGQVTSSVLLCLKDIPTILRINSYSILCPVGKIIPNSLDLCDKSFSKNCIKCVGLPLYIYSKLKYIINKRLLKNVDLFIALSNYMGKAIKDAGFKPVKVIYNGIELSECSVNLESNNLLYVGRLSKEKGVEYLLKAIPYIINIFPKVRLKIIGDGSEKKSLISLAKRLKILKHVKFVGQISNKSTGKYYEWSSIVIMPSIWSEPFGNTGVEILNKCRPVIGTDVGGIPEWLDNGKTGFLVPPKNSDAIAEKVIYLLKRPKLMQKMGLAGRKKAEKEFDIKDYTIKIEKVYQELIKNNKK